MSRQGANADAPRLLGRILRDEPAAELRLEGMTWYDGLGAAAATVPLGIRGGRFTLTPAAGWRAVDLRGWTLLPGLCDAHQHLFHTARRTLRVDLGGIRERSLVWERLLNAPAAGPVIGEAWDESEWDDPRAPTRTELDDLFPDRPVVLIRICGHVAVANSEAIGLSSGAAAADRTGAGYFTEGDAVALARAFEADRDAVLAATARRADELAAEGVTAVTEMGARDLPRLAAALPGTFPLRFGYFSPAGVDTLPAARERGVVAALGAKLFLDGSVGGRTAALLGRYDDGGEGELLMEEGDLCRTLERIAAAGWRAALHVIGDRALAQALACLETVAPPAGSVRLEHVEMVRPGQLERAAALGCGVCFQPNFMDRWGRAGGLYEQRLGSGFRDGFARPADFRRAGLAPAYGTDGMPPEIWPALRAAVDRDLFGDAADSATGALAAVTGAAAELAGGSGRYGGVAEALAADFCLVRNDPVADNFREKPEVALTVMGGRPTWINTDIKDG